MSAAPTDHGVATPDAAARTVAAELVAIALVELAALGALAAVGGAASGALLVVTIVIAFAIGITRALAAAAIVRGQRVLHRAAIAVGEERFVPSARIVEIARRAPLALAWAAPPVAGLALAGISPAIALLAAATAIVTAPAVEARVRRAMEAWLDAIADEDLPERSLRSEALAHAGIAAAPGIAIALVALAIAPGIAKVVALLAVVPALALAARAWSEVVRARRELADVAGSIARIRLEPSGSQPPPAVATPDARRAHAAALGMVRAAADAVRLDAEAQRAIEREEQVRSRFMAAMGHELRSPLNSIVGFAQLLEDGTDGPLDPPQKESVTLIRRSAEDLLLLLTDILDSARLDADRLRLRKAWTPSVEIVTEAVRIGRSIVEGQSLAIEAQVQPGLPPVFVDRARIVQAVVATFRHAVRSTSSRVIEVRARVGPDPSRRRSLLVEVRDAERTLGRDELERIFDAFRDLRDASTGRRIGGLGLALSLARKLVRLHGGEVWAESSREAGTRYVVALPLD